VIPIPMDGPEVVGILAGDPPLIPYARAAMQWHPGKGRYAATLSNSRIQQKIFIHPHLLRPTLVTCHTGGKLFYRIEYEDFAKRTGGAAVPRRILFEMPAKNIRLRVRIREVEHNPDLTDDMFELLPPDEIAIERLD